MISIDKNLDAQKKKNINLELYPNVPETGSGKLNDPGREIHNRGLDRTLNLPKMQMLLI